MTLTACRTARLLSPTTAGPPLWRVNGSPGTAHLMGQLPLPAGAMWLVLKIETAFAASNELWIENPDFTREEVDALLRDPPPEPRLSVAQFLPSGDLERLHRALAASGGDPAALDATPADDAYRALSGMIDQRSGADFANLPERVMRARAKANGLAIHTEWSSLREVSTFIPRAPDPLTLQLIRMSIDGLEDGPRSDLVDAWLTGDTGPLQQIARQRALRYPELYARLSTFRNTRMAERLARRMAEGHSPFACLGILHLVGPDSVPDLLASQGMRVKRV
jgi:uncharacterized protein